MSQKEDFVRRAVLGEEYFSHLCNDYKITRKTGYRLVKRYQEEGLAGLAPRSKRPLTSPSKTCLKAEKALIELRVKRPTWGPKKLLKFLNTTGMKSLPALSTAHLILKRQGLITIEESLKRTKFKRFERAHPNELWQMDFKGHFQLLTKENCYPLTIVDDCSRYAISLRACKNEQYLPVKTQLSHIFEQYGLPAQMNVDNGNPWGNSSLLPYTQCALWLMQLGIKVTHSRPRHPQTNGKCERFHRTLKEDLISRYPMQSFSQAQRLFDQWRQDYNHVRPHEAIGMEVPAQRYTKSQKAMPTLLSEPEYPPGSILRKVGSNGYISYQGKAYLVGKAFKHHYIHLKEDNDNRGMILYFRNLKLYHYEH